MIEFLLAAAQALTFHPAPTGAALSIASEPTFPGSHYVEQGERYFDTLDSYANSPRPDYSSHVIRWEWEPWLLLTGHKDHWMEMDRVLVLFPTEVVDRDCRAFPVQPFARCRVTFHYKWTDAKTPIYEEFTFNDAGQITFIEVWSDEAGLRPMDPETDFWAENIGIERISTSVPGLGEPGGRYHPLELAKQAQDNPQLQELVNRLRTPVVSWFRECIRFLLTSGSESAPGGGSGH